MQVSLGPRPGSSLSTIQISSWASCAYVHKHHLQPLVPGSPSLLSPLPDLQPCEPKHQWTFLLQEVVKTKLPSDSQSQTSFGPPHLRKWPQWLSSGIKETPCFHHVFLPVLFSFGESGEHHMFCWILVPQPGIELGSSAVRVWSP